MNYDRHTSAGYLTNWAARLFLRALERRLGKGAGPMPVFFALQGGKALTQKELAISATVEQPTMANTLARMERDGLVVRRPDPNDRRSALVELTTLGRERGQDAFAAAMEVNALATSALTPEQEKQYYDLLHRVIAVLERDAANAGESE
ncbi:MAG: MarR family winged helix-turn-helix transcriptional regulator [Devosia sp.]